MNSESWTDFERLFESKGTPKYGWCMAWRGVTKRMLAAALQHARAQGAAIVEAYPVDEDSPSYRYMGFVPLFADAGFIEIGREGTCRHVMQRRIGSTRKTLPATLCRGQQP